MLDPIEKEISGYTFTLHPLNPFKAAVLDKKLITLLVPIIAGFKDLDENNLEESLDQMLDFKAISEGISTALGNMKDADFEYFIKELLKSAIVQTRTNGAHVCTDPKGEEVFEGNVFLIYEVIFEIMRFNKFSPFALAGRGEGIKQMVSSVVPRGKQKRRGPLSRKSEN